MSVKISQLPQFTAPLTGSEEVPVVQGGVTKKITVKDLTGVSLDVESGIDPTVFSTLVKTNDRASISGNVRESWRLIASTPLESFDPYVGSENVYVKYVGKIVVPVGTTTNIASQNGIFSSTDTDLGTLITPFAPGGLVTNFNTGEFQSVQIAALQIDNTLFEEEYEIFILAADSNDFESAVTIDVTFFATEGSVITLDRG
jgi:hypothetical protein